MDEPDADETRNRAPASSGLQVEASSASGLNPPPMLVWAPRTAALLEGFRPAAGLEGWLRAGKTPLQRRDGPPQQCTTDVMMGNRPPPTTHQKGGEGTEEEKGKEILTRGVEPD